MNTLSNNQFGLMVAYLLPGFIGLGGIAFFSPIVAGWLQPGLYAEAGLGPPIYAVLAAATIGMIIGCVRWFFIDRIHNLTGLLPPTWDDRRLNERLGAFNYLVENHYRYYQFYANTLVAVVFAYSINRWIGTSALLGVGTDLGIIALCGALFAGSRDSLTKYYARTNRLIGQVAQKGSEIMTNGNHHEAGGGVGSSRKHAPVKPEPKPEIMPKAEGNKPPKKPSAKQ